MSKTKLLAEKRPRRELSPHKCQFKNQHKENNRVPSLFDFDQIDVKIGVFRWKICSVLALKLRYVINKIKNR